MTPSLEEKIAAMIAHLSEHRDNLRRVDILALESYLDDPELGAWLDNMNKQGRVKNTRFTRL